MRGFITAGALGALAWAACCAASAETVAEPATFASHDGVLDLLIIARTTTVTGLTTPGYRPTAWAYQVCPRPRDGGDACPADTPTPYGGVRLALQPGDLLKIRLVNHLPPVDPAALESAPDDPLLKLNPTNFHTHGLIVDATANTAAPPQTPVYGDFIFTSIFNPANGDPAQVNLDAYNSLHAHGDVVKGGVVDYRIRLPANHPSGAFWFHPHMHGITVNQISAGLSGVISVGGVGDYACFDPDCRRPIPESAIRHLMLREMQALPGPNGGAPQFQTDSGFCAPDPTDREPPRAGVCPALTASYPQGGYWFFTINGAQYPTLPVASPDGQVWRLQNASASATYDIAMTDDWTQRKMPLQILAIDGVSIDIPPGAATGDIVRLAGGRFKIADCPTRVVNAGPGARESEAERLGAANARPPVCASEIYMMPSSRVEVWATYTDADNRLAEAPAGGTATLRNFSFNTGPTGDDWPSVKLAEVTFAAGLRGSDAPQIYVRGDARRDALAAGIFRSAHEGPGGGAAAPARCAAIPANHRRRLFFANMGNDEYGNSIFGIGYEEIDERGATVPGTFQPVEQFNPAHEICLPLGPGDTPRQEVWELVNLSAELHNFHIHQTKFKVIGAAAPAGSLLSANSPDGDGVEEDNVPLPYAVPVGSYQYPATGACTVDDYRAGRCTVSPVLVKIPFSRLGRFVFHCHILEHEDGGMMRVVQVVRSH